MMYRDNTAYDFEMFAPKKKVVEIPDHKGKQKRGVSKSKLTGVSVNKGTLVAVGAVVATLLLIFAQGQKGREHENIDCCSMHG